MNDTIKYNYIYRTIKRAVSHLDVIKKQSGLYTIYFDNGNINREYDYDSGKTKEYYKNGKIKLEKTTKLNLLEDKYKEWNSEGKLISYLLYDKNNVINDLLKSNESSK